MKPNKEQQLFIDAAVENGFSDVVEKAMTTCTDAGDFKLKDMGVALLHLTSAAVLAAHNLSTEDPSTTLADGTTFGIIKLIMKSFEQDPMLDAAKEVMSIIKEMEDGKIL